MNNNRQKRIFTILDSVISLEPTKRSGYLTEVCGDDEILRKEVESLLASVRESESFWEEWQSWNDREIEQLFKESPYEDNLPEKIGPWQPVKILGKGGMGTVYLADRIDGDYELKAAVKLLHREFEPGETVRRFEQERQILAKLEHEHIARFYDGGLTADGRPWLAMKYVDGISISDWCHSKKCSLQQRLELFMKVCQAVQYAHKNLIVHRDLKPDNILVAKNGAIKVLDFGIAKMLDQDPTEKGHVQTQTGMRLMSLDYAAPEQITGDTITTATDVYALGILLYELLTGTYPFDLDEKNQQQTEQILRNQDPEKPSQKHSQWKDKLRGDLDAIVLKAIRKEPDQRYENAGQLLDDINRHLLNLPVFARQDTVRYRFSKFYKRYRGKVVSGIIASVVIISLVAYYSFRIMEERNAAQIQAQKAERISGFLAALFKASDPGEALGASITAEDLLQRGSVSIEKELSDEPEVKASILEVLGTVYSNMGNYEKAQTHLEESLHLKHTYLDSDDQEIAKNLNKIAAAQLYQGQRQEARKSLLEALNIHEEGGNPDYDNYASTLNNLGSIYLNLNNLDSAEVMLRNAVELRRRYLGGDSPQLATNLDGLAITLERKGDIGEAEKLYRESLDIRKINLDPGHPDLARSYNNLAGFMYRREDYESAEPLYRDALKIWQKVHENVHPDVARGLNNLGAVLEKQDKLDEAEEIYREALEIKKEILDENHLSLAYSLSNLGLLLEKKKNYEEAESFLKESLQIRRNNFTDPHATVAKGIGNLASLYIKIEEYKLAASYYREEIALRNKITPADSSQIVFAEIALATCLTALLEFDEAERLLMNNYLKIENKIDPQNPHHKFLLQKITDLYTFWEKPDEASYYYAMIDQQ